jgi:hypothetical protein
MALSDFAYKVSPHAVSSFYPDSVFYVYVLRSESDCRLNVDPK